MIDKDIQMTNVDSIIQLYKTYQNRRRQKREVKKWIGLRMDRSDFRSIDNPKAFIKMSRGHKVKGVRWIDRGLEQPHKFQIEGDKLLVILDFLLQTDG